MKLVAQFDEILEVGGPAVDPMPHMVDVGEFGVGATGKPTAFVASSDLQTLTVARVTAGPAEIEAAAVGPIG